MALLAALAAWLALFDHVPGGPLWVAVVIASCAVVPVSFGLLWVALPLREARGLLPIGIAFAVLAVIWHLADLDAAGNLAKLAATTALAWWFLSYFEQLSWIVIVAGVIPLVDAVSVWRGPTRHIVEDQPEVFGALSYAIPVPDGTFSLGLPDVLFFALFLGGAARWGLRVAATWLAMVASFGITMALAIWVDPFGIGGLPALPGLSIAFLAANADLLWTRLREQRERRDSET